MGRNVIRLSESRGIVVEAIVALYAERALTTAALARGERLEGLEVTHPTLEDIYLELTGTEGGS